MLDNTFIFKNKRAKSKGIELQSSISISAAVPNAIVISIPGRSGDLIEYDGSYENRRITAQCYLLDYALEKNIDKVNNWLLGENGYFRFEDSQDTKHFMLARVVRGIEKNVRADLLNPFTLEFDAKPQRFLKLGEKAVDVTSTKSIYNPTAFSALPLIQVEGSSTVEIKINGVTLTLNMGEGGIIIYDADTDNAFYEDKNYNRSVSVTDTMMLSKGMNNIEITGSVTSLKITPRWWEL